MNEVRKYYRKQVASIQRKLERRQKWLELEGAGKKDDWLADYTRDVTEREVFSLQQELREAKRLLKLHSKH